MYKIIKNSSPRLSEVKAFVEKINTERIVSELFESGRDIIVTRAPGRLDVMGGIADYSGSLVLQLPIQEATLVALQRTPTRELHILSLGAEGNNRDLVFTMPLSVFERHHHPVDYSTAQVYFKQNPENSWAAYVAGAFLVLMQELQVEFEHGANIMICSEIPEGKGVSSSAALEVATMQAICTAFDITLEPRSMALLCQKVENLIVGAPCGVMDQLTSVCGESDRLLALLCQPAEIKGTVDLPEHLALWGIDSGVRHSVSGSDYSSVRIGAFMGYRIIADLAKLVVNKIGGEDFVQVEDPRWSGYLANISVSEFEETYSGFLPEAIQGNKFIAEYGGTTDTVTEIDPNRTYAVRTPTAHPIYEYARVRTFCELLVDKTESRQPELLGDLMYQSHASYSACGLGSTATDRLVNLVRDAGHEKGLYGAKITGGGSGGTVAVLGLKGAEVSIEEIAGKYALETGYHSHVFRKSSSGAAAFGNLTLRRFDQIS